MFQDPIHILHLVVSDVYVCVTIYVYLSILFQLSAVAPVWNIVP